MFSKDSFAQRLSLLRSCRGISQSELAKQLGVGRTAVAMMETGQRGASLEIISALADFFDVPADFLLARPPFDDWDNLQKYRSSVVDTTASMFGFDPAWLNALPVPQFIRIFGSLYASVSVNPAENTVDLYPLIPPDRLPHR